MKMSTLFSHHRLAFNTFFIEFSSMKNVFFNIVLVEEVTTTRTQPAHCIQCSEDTYPPAGRVLFSRQLVSSTPGQHWHRPHLTLPHTLPPRGVAERQE